MSDHAADHATDLDFDTDDYDDLRDMRLLHDRVYRVRAYYQDEGHMRLRGMVRDRKPEGLYLTGDDKPLVVHHMVLDLTIGYPTLDIVDASCLIETHPHEGCPRIQDHYKNLIGLSIARGFTHKVRELFGGPRGCTHTTALLQAMAPVAVQATWSMRSAQAQNAGGAGGTPVGAPKRMTPEQRRQNMRFNLNTCHVWAEDGEMVAAIDRGEEIPIPVWAERRLREMGRDPSEWRRPFDQGD